jgi:hypothetical protein
MQTPPRCLQRKCFRRKIVRQQMHLIVLSVAYIRLGLLRFGVKVQLLRQPADSRRSLNFAYSCSHWQVQFLGHGIANFHYILCAATCYAVLCARCMLPEP